MGANYEKKTNYEQKMSPNYDHKKNYEQKMNATDSFPTKKDNNFISAINGNIVHVTVNNFIATDKKPERSLDKSHIIRPFSSDNKERIDREYRAKQI